MSLKPCPYRQVDDEGHILCDKIKTGDREVSPNVCRACPVSAINCAHLRATLDHQTRPPITVRYGNGKTEVWEDEVPSIALGRAACAVKVTPILSPRDCAGCPLRQALISPDAITTTDATIGRERPVTTPAPTIATAPVEQIVQPVAPTRRTTARPRTSRAVPAGPVPAVAAPAPAAMAASAAPTMIAAAATAAAYSNKVAENAVEEKRSSIVARKIIKLQEWLEKQTSAPAPHDDELENEPDSVPRRAAFAPPMPPRATPPPPRLEEKRVGWTD